MKTLSLVVLFFLSSGSLLAQIYVNGGTSAILPGTAVAGKIGIGPNSGNPSATLQVGGGAQGLINLGGYAHTGALRSSGDAFIGMNVYAAYNDTTDNSKIRVFQTNSNGYSAIHFSYRGAISFYSKRAAVTANDRINTTSAATMRIVNGNVGIGTEGPGAQLAVARSGYTGMPAHSSLTFINQSSNPSGNDLKPALELNNSGGSGYGLVSIAPSNYLSGNVGIGTTSVGSMKLAVEGKIGAREVNVLVGAWPDYVFSKNYDLLPLSELAAYINQNNHLPEIPTAKEVEANGVDLGKMNALLLKKIEEMTLYMVDMQKENAEMKERLIKIEEKIKDNK